MRIIRNSIIGALRFIYFLLVFALILLLVLYFGRTILGPGLTGSDNANFLTLASWLSKWWPKIPFWYPQQGGGMSFTASYPILNHLIVVVIEKITGLPLAVSFRIWSLVTIALTSIGLYFLSFRLTKNQTVSSLAALFYLICPITWVFLLEWGFAAEQLSYLLVPPILIFVSLFLDEFFTSGLTTKSKIYFLLFVLGFSLLVPSHFMMFIGTLIFLAILLPIYPILNGGVKGVGIKKVAMVALVSIITALLLSTYWLIPFLKYQINVDKGGPIARELSNKRGIMQTSVYALNVFNITTQTSFYDKLDKPLEPYSSLVFRNVSFPLAISILALIGLIGSFFLNRKVFAFGAANIIPLILGVMPSWNFVLLKFPFAGYLSNWRSNIFLSRFIIPLLAAFGCYAIAYLVSFPLELISKKVQAVFLKVSAKGIFIVLSTVLTLVVAGAFLWQFKNWPDNPEYLISYGLDTSVPSRQIDTRNMWGKEVDYCLSGGAVEDKLRCDNTTLNKYFWEWKLWKTGACGQLKERENPPKDALELCGENPSSQVIHKVVDICRQKNYPTAYSGICDARVQSFWSQITFEAWVDDLKNKDMFGEGKQILGLEREIFAYLPDNPKTRVDVGTSHGGLLMAEPFYSEMPELPLYYNQATLIKTLWNYEISVFNQEKSPWPQANIMYELSKYFGLEYDLIEAGAVPLDRFRNAGWEKVTKWGPGEEDMDWLALWKFKEPVGLLRVTTKPTVLVIGQDKVDGYFRIFHLANLGVLPFEDGLIVKGGSYVDTYTANDLKKFDAVVLEGYAYKNQKQGWKVLDEYVKSGGNLLINTGWQYSSADWTLSKTPNFIPLSSLEWGGVGSAGDYIKEDSQIAGDVDTEKFDPLVFGKNKWSVSSSQRSNLRSWAKVVLSVNDKPLIAGGNYGSGKVVWLGLDLPGHIGAYKDNEEEIRLYKNLMAYLLDGKGGRVLSASFKRDYPDKLEITINETSNAKTAVYFSEAYYPDFKAKLVSNGKSEKLGVYKAGPGMTMFILPKVTAGSKIIYEYETPPSVIIARIVSLTTLIFLISIVIHSKILFGIKTNIVDRLFTGKLKKRMFGERGDEDVNY